MNDKSLDKQLFDINKFLSAKPSPDIHSIQNYASTIDISNIFSFTFNAPFETLPLLAKIDTAAEKILHFQFPYLTSAIVFSDGNCLLNSLSLIFAAN
jgi:hypothetical protein